MRETFVTKQHADMVMILWMFLGFLGMHRFVNKQFATGSIQLLVCTASFFCAAKALHYGMSLDPAFMYYLAGYGLLFITNIVMWVVDYAIIVRPIKRMAGN